jgi:tetratricopeptide (TPR) repeat protein
LILGLACGVLAHFLHNLVDVGLRWTAPAITFWFAFALTIALIRQTEPRPKNSEAQVDCPEKDKAIMNKASPATTYISSGLLLISALALFALLLCEFLSSVYLARYHRFMALGEKQKAAQSVLTACRLNPYNLPAYYVLGHVYAQLGSPNEALQAYQRLSQFAPNYTQIHYNLAGVYGVMNRVDEAIAEAQKAVAFNNDSAEGHALLADLLTKKQRFSEAIAEFQCAIKLDEKLLYAYDRLGDTYLLTQQFDASIAAYQKVLQKVADQPDALFGIAESFLRQGKQKEAEWYFKQLMAKHPQNPLAKLAREKLKESE